jgi:seryl-tRNA synthetase
MLALKLIRDNTDLVRDGLRKLNATAPIDEIIAADDERRRLLLEAEALKAERNTASKQIGQMKDKTQAGEIKERMRAVGERIKGLDLDLAVVEQRLNDLMLQVPNLPHASLPEGPDETHNIVARSWGATDAPVGLHGEAPAGWQPLPHWEIGEKLGIIDFERGVKLSGARFYVLKGLGARLQRALIAYMLDLHTSKHGYTEIYPPYLVKKEMLYGAGQLPKFAENIYHDQEDDLWLIGTAEIPLTNLHRDELLDGERLPVNYVAYSACFRREKMSAGRDVRGIKRVHQFDKVEMYKFVAPEASYDELEKLLDNAEDVARGLGLPYRVIMMCTGDLGFTATKKYDIEMWAPGCKEWLEVSSCSNCEDFQARRANVRYRATATSRPEFVHTLNGSGLALPRTMIAILEQYQQPDGTVIVPAALRPYMGGVEVIK